MEDNSKFSGLNDGARNTLGRFIKNSHGTFNMTQGVYIARVIDNVDSDYLGHVWVEIVGQQSITDTSSASSRQSNFKIRRPMPFGGSVQGSNYSNTYGSSFPPPATGTEVLVAFTGTDQEGFLLGVLPDANRNSSVPGLPSNNVDGEGAVGPTFDTAVGADGSKNNKTRHPVANAHAVQGIGYDAVRGPGSSGGRRESPSNVAGFLTPGGHGIVMDDGTLPVKEGASIAPDKSREAGKSNLIRIRSGSGAQFLINDSAGIVYLINQNGSSWIQMDSAGNVDIYAQGSVSMHAETDFNLHVGGDFNLDADGINIKSRGSDGIKLESGAGGVDLYSNKELRLFSNIDIHQKAIGSIRMSTGGMIDLNGPPAATASKTTPNNITTNRGVKESTAGRVPEHEPWGAHTETDTVVPAQAPSSSTLTTKDYDLSKPTGASGQGAATGAAPKTGITGQGSTTASPTSFTPRGAQ
jgi:uncharacterized protein (DUF2345 family)